MEEDFGEVMQARQITVLPTIGVCSLCGRKFPDSEFQSRINLIEFIISGLCQKCQDETAEEGK